MTHRCQLLICQINNHTPTIRWCLIVDLVPTVFLFSNILLVTMLLFVCSRYLLNSFAFRKWIKLGALTSKRIGFINLQSLLVSLDRFTYSKLLTSLSLVTFWHIFHIPWTFYSEYFFCLHCVNYDFFIYKYILTIN